MAVSSATSWVDSTSVAASTGSVRLKSIRATLNPSATDTSYIQLFDASSATPGVSTPVAVIPVLAPSGNRTKSFPFPGGLRFSTALEWFVATTLTGGTAATTSAPLQVDIHYTPGG